MTNIRRYFRPGDISFLTHVTYNRLPILVDNIDLWKRAITDIGKLCRFELMAWVVLSDHFHILVKTDSDDISGLMRRIKLSFSMNFRKRHGMRKGRIWQFRFWDHIIRDQQDLNCHVDYIHYNPVKHDLVQDPFKYPYSSLSQYFRRGYYTRDWGKNESIGFDGEFGE